MAYGLKACSCHPLIYAFFTLIFVLYKLFTAGLKLELINIKVKFELDFYKTFFF